MDKTGADFEMSVESIRDKLLANPIVLQIPIGAESTFVGVVDLVEMKAIFYQPEVLGARFEERDIPAEMQAVAQTQRGQMIELAAEYDEQLMDAYVHDEPVSPDMINRAIRKGTLACKLHPVFVGSALKYVGIQRVLDGVLAYMPSPLDRPDIVGHKPGDEKKQIVVKCDRNGSLVALAFKITSDSHGDLYFLRIYQGLLKSGTRVLDANRKRRENITRLFEMHADERRLLDSAAAGDIVAVVGLKETLTGDTICDTKHPICLPSITFPETVISMSIEPRTAAERTKLGDALAALRREDPTFGCKVDKETGQLIISGMGELHLEVLEHKLVKEKGVNVRVGKPRVAYKESITEFAEAEGKFVRQTGGRGQYGHVVLTVEPLVNEDGRCSREIEFESKASGQMVPKEYVSAVAKAAKEALGSGVLAGYPVVGVRVTLIDGSFHSVDSSELAFEQATAIAVEKVLKKAEPVLLEPIMRLQVVVPESSFGVVQGGLLGKRGVITDSWVHGNMRVIDAKVPLAEMFGYSGEIRSATAGRGTFTMEPLSYEKTPVQIAEQIIL
jgi:elongation factor G